MRILFKSLTSFFLFLSLFSFSNLNAQVKDSTQNNSVDTLKKEYHFSGSISATNNGISFIPTFSLGKPATILNFSLGGPKFSFEPELRFSIEGRPWSFIFWWRYKLVNTKKFRLNLGAHPSLSYKIIESTVNGGTTKSITAVRYAASEWVPTYVLSDHVTLGAYYLFSHGLDYGAIKNTHFLTLNADISNINLFNDLFLKFKPQVYYLQLDHTDGYYVSTALTLTKKNCPFSLSTVSNKIIRSNIVSPSFVWNATIAYSFNNKFYHK